MLAYGILEQIQRSLALPTNIKCNCVVLFLGQLYWLFIYASNIYFPIDNHCTISSIKQNCVLFIHRGIGTITTNIRPIHNTNQVQVDRVTKEKTRTRGNLCATSWHSHTDFSWYWMIHLFVAVLQQKKKLMWCLFSLWWRGQEICMYVDMQMECVLSWYIRAVR